MDKRRQKVTYDYLYRAYNRFFEETYNEQSYRDVNYYLRVKIWLAQNGCQYDPFRIPADTPIWESESKRIEFMLRWV